MKDDEIKAIIGLLKLGYNSRIKRNDGYFRLDEWKRICLEVFYYFNKYPSTAQKEYLSITLGISHKKIQIWLQNRRNVNKIYIKPTYKPVLDAAIENLKVKLRYLNRNFSDIDEVIATQIFIDIYENISKIDEESD
ncbi:Homeobox protein HD-7 [Dictyocoela muelleri]|nr:Homeobox protein HD-7 [Dictyocoela muelleri]